jgi:hypothetical protein
MITERHPAAPALRLPAWLAPLTRTLRHTASRAEPKSLAAAQNSWWRKGLALIAVALLSVPSAVGVFRALEPTRGPLAAGLAAAGFESVYLATALLLLSPELHRFAQRTALSAVAVAVLLNTVADYSLRTAQHDAAGAVIRHGLSSWPAAVDLFDPLALGLSLVESLPLAALAYAMATLLHRLAMEESQGRQHDAEAVRAEVQLHAELAQRDDELAQLRASHTRLTAEVGTHSDTAAQQIASAVQATQALEAQLAQERAARAEQGATLAQLRAAEADQGATLAQLRAELAQRDAQFAQLCAAPAQAGELDLRALATALRETRAEPRPWRQIEELIKTPQSTVRSWLTARPERESA